MVSTVQRHADRVVPAGVRPGVLQRLTDPFLPEEIGWRVRQAGEKNGRIWCVVIPYLTARAVMERLDTVVGPANWAPRYRRGPVGGTLCGLAIRVDGEWVMKWDGAGASDVEPTKGAISNALKRAAVVWGMGRRQLYGIGTLWGRVHSDGRETGRLKDGRAFRWDPPALPNPAPRPDPALHRPSSSATRPPVDDEPTERGRPEPGSAEEPSTPAVTHSVRRATTTRTRGVRAGAASGARKRQGLTLGVLGVARAAALTPAGTAALAEAEPSDPDSVVTETEAAKLPTLLELDDALADLVAASAETGLRADAWLREHRAEVERSEARAQEAIARLRRRAQDARAARGVA